MSSRLSAVRYEDAWSGPRLTTMHCKRALRRYRQPFKSLLNHLHKNHNALPKTRWGKLMTMTNCNNASLVEGLSSGIPDPATRYVPSRQGFKSSQGRNTTLHMPRYPATARRREGLHVSEDMATGLSSGSPKPVHHMTCTRRYKYNAVHADRYHDRLPRAGAHTSVKELRPRNSPSQAPVASVNNRPVATCRTPRTTRWRRSAAKQKDTTTTTWSEHVVFSDRPGELPAARIGGVVVFGRTSFRDVRIPCGPPSRAGDREGLSSDNALLESQRNKREYANQDCSAGAEITCSTCADSPLELPRCPCEEANRESAACHPPPSNQSAARILPRCPDGNIYTKEADLLGLFAEYTSQSADLGALAEFTYATTPRSKQRGRVDKIFKH